MLKGSKYLSLLLRHKPEIANLILDKEGWCDVKELLSNIDISFEELELIVNENDKKRFAFNSDKTKIRASQGHSITKIDLNLKPITPPSILYHGTKIEFIKNILKEGLKSMNRNHVHLSADIETAIKVASRRKGENIILEINSAWMRAENYRFYLSDNGVWLTSKVPSKFIKQNKNK